MYLSIIQTQLKSKTVSDCGGLCSCAEEYARTSIEYDSTWAKGHLRLAQVLRYTSTEDAVDAMIKFMKIAKKGERDSAAAKEARVNIKYYTHRKVMMLSPSWHMVKHPNNCYSVDPEGAGHYQDLRQIYANSAVLHQWATLPFSYLIRPGMYCCNFPIAGAKVHIDLFEKR